MGTLASLLLRVRPAPVASLVARLCGLNKRRLVRTGHGVFFVNPVSNMRAGILAGDYEPHMRAVLERYLFPGAVFIDLGANEGYFSVLAAKLVGPKGAVIAVEPQSRLQAVIQANFEANACYNARLIRCVVAGQTEKTRLSLAPEVNSGGSSLFPHTKYAQPMEEVRSYRLGDFLDRAGIEGCDLMKVDIEGAEFDVFMQAGDVLRTGILKHVSLEIHGSILASRGLSGDTLHQHMLRNGYEVNTELGNWVYSFHGSRGDG
jgi:FkbM family methyltransferase